MIYTVIAKSYDYDGYGGLGAVILLFVMLFGIIAVILIDEYFGNRTREKEVERYKKWKEQNKYLSKAAPSKPLLSRSDDKEKQYPFIIEVDDNTGGSV